MSSRWSPESSAASDAPESVPPAVVAQPSSGGPPQPAVVGIRGVSHQGPGRVERVGAQCAPFPAGRHPSSARRCRSSPSRSWIVWRSLHTSMPSHLRDGRLRAVEQPDQELAGDQRHREPHAQASDHTEHGDQDWRVPGCDPDSGEHHRQPSDPGQCVRHDPDAQPRTAPSPTPASTSNTIEARSATPTLVAVAPTIAGMAKPASSPQVVATTHRRYLGSSLAETLVSTPTGLLRPH